MSSTHQHIDGHHSVQDCISMFTNPEAAKCNKRQIRILSLDNIGAGGYSTIMILERIMKEVQEKDNSVDVPHPYMYFDLICGTGTGGLIALMLGRLKMVNIPHNECHK
jgi:patatin-like phospholipase/acyl hydrolase